MRQTLLQITQGILSDMESDEVNSINDTTESYAVAQTIKQSFYDCAVELGLPEHYRLFELNASGDPTKPCIMTVPDNVCRIEWIRYDNKTADDDKSRMVDVMFKPLDEFIESTRGLASDTGTQYDEMVVTSNSESFNFTYRNDEFPTYYTTFDDRTLIFDAVNLEYDTTLMKSKTMCYGVTYPLFLLEDAYYPEIDPTQFSYLISKAKTRAFYQFKQMTNEESGAEARKQKIVLQKRKRRIPVEQEIFRGPRYGRK